MFTSWPAHMLLELTAGLDLASNLERGAARGRMFNIGILLNIFKFLFGVGLILSALRGQVSFWTVSGRFVSLQKSRGARARSENLHQLSTVVTTTSSWLTHLSDISSEGHGQTLPSLPDTLLHPHVIKNAHTLSCDGLLNPETDLTDYLRGFRKFRLSTTFHLFHVMWSLLILLFQLDFL